MELHVIMMTSQAKSASDGRMPIRNFKLYFDGGCRPNPGQMETAVVARGVTHHRPDCGYGTNNDAEWLALLHAVELALANGLRDVVLLGDSASVIGQANDLTKCRSGSLRDHYLAFLALKPQFDRIRVRRISRHQNLAGIALNKARWS